MISTNIGKLSTTHLQDRQSLIESDPLEQAEGDFKSVLERHKSEDGTDRKCVLALQQDKSSTQLRDSMKGLSKSIDATRIALEAVCDEICNTAEQNIGNEDESSADYSNEVIQQSSDKSGVNEIIQLLGIEYAADRKAVTSEWENITPFDVSDRFPNPSSIQATTFQSNDILSAAEGDFSQNIPLINSGRLRNIKDEIELKTGEVEKTVASESNDFISLLQQDSVTQQILESFENAIPKRSNTASAGTAGLASDQLALSQFRDGRVLRIELKPADLGDVEVVLRKTSSGLKVHMVVSTESVAQLIQTDLSVLKERLVDLTGQSTSFVNVEIRDSQISLGQQEQRDNNYRSSQDGLSNSLMGMNRNSNPQRQEVVTLEQRTEADEDISDPRRPDSGLVV